MNCESEELLTCGMGILPMRSKPVPQTLFLSVFIRVYLWRPVSVCFVVSVVSRRGLEAR